MKFIKANTCSAFPPCVSIRYVIEADPETTMLKFSILKVIKLDRNLFSEKATNAMQATAPIQGMSCVVPTGSYKS